MEWQQIEGFETSGYQVLESLGSKTALLPGRVVLGFATESGERGSTMSKIPPDTESRSAGESSPAGAGTGGDEGLSGMDAPWFGDN